MGWDKNTVNHSQVDTIISVLKQLNYPYEIREIGQVVGSGANDSGKTYPMRRLSYGEWVVLEYIQRSNDCDADDYICSETFRKDQEPKDWAYSRSEPSEVFVGDDYAGHYGIPEGFDPSKDEVEDSYDYAKVLNEPDTTHEKELDENDSEFYNG